ncbi:MAG TPA: ABC transporter substrate-binding protein [Jatrophihabitans sp.]|jgi:multiple sugar transport system substrate-binding protein
MPETPTPFTPTRRTVLKGAAIGAAGIAGLPLLAACTGTSKGGSSSNSTTLGSSASDPIPKAGIAALVKAYEKKSSDTVTVNTVSHNDFQEKINSYLQGSPDDAFTWFAGYRMRYYAAKGLVAPLDDVWDKLGADNFGKGIQAASTGDDGKKYFVPNYNYPWAIFYRKSLWQQKGYQVPTTWDDLKTLCAQMKKDGLIPISFGDKDGWPAMGTFDYLNMRLNGYQFHIDLMAHKESWDSKQVKDVFDTWKSVLQYQDPGALGLTWEDSAQKLAQKKAGMYLLGSFVTQQFTDPKIKADVDFFEFPSLTEANGQDALEAPIDGFMLSTKGGSNQAAKDMLAYFGSPEGQNTYSSKDPNQIETNLKADFSYLDAIGNKAQQTIAKAKYISQFLDRDALPQFASDVMIPALQTFIKNGQFDTANVEKQAKALYAAQ